MCVAAGWTKDVKGIIGALFTATKGMNDTDSITRKISANGKALTENTTTGEFASVTCNADSVAIAETFGE